MGKCSDTVVGLDMLVGLLTGLRCSLKPPFSRVLVSLLYIACDSVCTESCKLRFFELQVMW